ncbi:proline-rich protein 2-like [Prionailurus viverrinus]|uniref:proline-rich protein 2-like n=1 Tax=Prionailurus viverrinus TaxID=61388 RepID=UPI001FF153D7|nr:proline-rich protein 2-like [Prionailurus viverrinus]
MAPSARTVHTTASAPCSENAQILLLRTTFLAPILSEGEARRTRCPRGSWVPPRGHPDLLLRRRELTITDRVRRALPTRRTACARSRRPGPVVPRRPCEPVRLAGPGLERAAVLQNPRPESGDRKRPRSALPPPERWRQAWGACWGGGPVDPGGASRHLPPCVFASQRGERSPHPEPAPPPPPPAGPSSRRGARVPVARPCRVRDPGRGRGVRPGHTLEGPRGPGPLPSLPRTPAASPLPLAPGINSDR